MSGLQGTVLGRIARVTGLRVAALKRREGLAALRRRALSTPEPLDFTAPFKTPGRHVIAEVKLASPSQGSIAPGMDPVAAAEQYAANGASALSVLTEPRFFGGSPAHLRLIRSAVRIPLLMKDFVVEEYQLYLARASGADAVLLIAALLDERRLRELIRLARMLGLAVLVEAHTPSERRRALASGADLVGINTRDLKTLRVDLRTARDLAPRRGERALFICESGIGSARDIAALARLGYRGFLVGTALMRTGKPGRALAALLGRPPVRPGTRVKVCGITRLMDAREAARLGAWAVGLVFHPRSPRFVPFSRAKGLLKSLPKSLVRVGVFLDPGEAELRGASKLSLDLVQVQGRGYPAAARIFGEDRLVRSLPLRSAGDGRRALGVRSAFFLADRPRDPAARIFGEKPDWGIAARLAAKRPRTLLAGGLTPENARAAIARARPWGVDVSSGVESSPGIKDKALLRRFFKSVQTADREEGA